MIPKILEESINIIDIQVNIAVKKLGVKNKKKEQNQCRDVIYCIYVSGWMSIASEIASSELDFDMDVFDMAMSPLKNVYQSSMQRFSQINSLNMP